jgi:hypothetical protein
MRHAFTIVGTLLLASAAWACNVPVFRYALERWRADSCELVVFHEGALSAGHESLLSELCRGESSPVANVEVVRADLSDPLAPHRELWRELASQGGAALPYAVLRTRLAQGRLVNGWRGPLDGIRQSGVIDSPARRELGRRLLSGHAIVWLLIGSDDAARDQQARRELEESIGALAGKVELPDGVGLPGSELHSEIPLLLRYSVLEIDRQDAQEHFLIQLLSGLQAQAVDQGEPLVVPVFGRGRALEVIPASDLSPQLTEDLTLFLCGACSCRVKEQNPGFDLLLSVDWDAELFSAGVEPPRESSSGNRSNGPVLLNIPPGAATSRKGLVP